MPCFDTPTRTRCVAILAAIAFHVLLLACLLRPRWPERVPSATQERLLTVILAPAPNPHLFPPAAPKKSQHGWPLSHLSSSSSGTHRQIRPTTEAVERRADTEKIVGEAPAAKAENNPDSSAAADSSNTIDLNRQPPNWTSNAGTLDQRWLPRNSDATQSGAARPNLGARTSEDAVERAVSRSARADCRTRYAHMGLLAFPFLLNDTARDHGCKW